MTLRVNNRGNASQVGSRPVRGPRDPRQLPVGHFVRGWTRVSFKNPGPSSSLDLAYNNLACGLPGAATVYSRYRISQISIYGAMQVDNWVRVAFIGNDYSSLMDFGSYGNSRPSVHFVLDHLTQMNWQQTSDTTRLCRVVANKGPEILVEFKYEAYISQQGCIPAYGFTKEERVFNGYQIPDCLRDPSAPGIEAMYGEPCRALQFPMEGTVETPSEKDGSV